MEGYIGDPVKKAMKEKRELDIVSAARKDISLSLSVCMIVKNEARNLPHVLFSIRGVADEIIVVDTGSTDETREIARSAGAERIRGRELME